MPDMKIKTIRSFIALPLSLDCKQKFYKVISNLRKDIPSGVRWVDNKNLHLTLKFMGELNPDDMPYMKSELEKSLLLTSEFNVAFQGLGLFPEVGKPKVIWVGISPQLPIKLIFEKVEKATSLIGYPKEIRGFSPHITLGRIEKENQNQDQIQIRDIITKKKGGLICTSTINKIVLYQSQLTPKGPVYCELITIGLKA